jgi:GntR family transcriptional regulator
MTLDSPSLPTYYLIKNLIRKRIVEGTYPLGTKIPSEMELSKEFGVHRLTARHALTLLVQEGYLERFRKRGTFVSKRVKEFVGLEFTGFFGDLFDHVVKFKAKKVEILSEPPPEMVADLFQLDPKKDQVTVIRRVRFLGKSPAAFTVSYLPLDVGSRLNKKDLYRMSLLKIFREKLHIPLGEAFQTIELTVADKHIAEALKIPLGGQILMIQRSFFTKDGKPFDFVQSYYRGDKFRFFVRFRYDDEEDRLLLAKWGLGKTEEI